jgi:hypothetical protein
MVIECLGYRRRASPSHSGRAMRKAGFSQAYVPRVGFERGRSVVVLILGGVSFTFVGPISIMKGVGTGAVSRQLRKGACRLLKVPKMWKWRLWSEVVTWS